MKYNYHEMASHLLYNNMKASSILDRKDAILHKSSELI